MADRVYPTNKHHYERNTDVYPRETTGSRRYSPADLQVTGTLPRSSSDPQLLASLKDTPKSSIRKKNAWRRGSNGSKTSNMSKSSTRSRGSYDRPRSGGHDIRRDPNSSLHRRAKSQDALLEPGSTRKARTASQRLQELLGGPQPVDQLGLLAYTAILNGDVESLKQIYKHRRVDVIDRDGNTALHVAARLASLPCLRWLLRNSHISVNVKNSRQESCAHQAVKQGQLKCLKSIIHCGSVKPLIIVCERDRQGLTVLHLAAILGHDVIIAWLVDAFGKSLALIGNDCAQTALHFAAAKGHSKSVQSLCKLGKQVTNVRDNIGATAAFYACQEGHTQSLYFLVNQGKCDVTLATNEGLTPLHAATQAGCAEVARIIIQRVDNVSLEKQTEDGATVFHMAAANGRRDILRLLLTQKGAYEAVRHRDARGGTPAHDAAANGHVECLKLLLQAGLELDLHDQEGETPLSLAQRTGGRCAQFVSTLYDGTLSQNGTVFNSISATVAADQMNQTPFDDFDVYSMSPDDALTFKQNGQSSKQKDKIAKLAKYLRNGLSGKNTTRLGQPEILQGEFLLRQIPPKGLSSREKRIFYSKDHSRDTILLRQKHRPAPLSLPYFEEHDFNSNVHSNNSKLLRIEMDPHFERKRDVPQVRGDRKSEPLPQEISITEPAPDYILTDESFTSGRRASSNDIIDYSNPKRPVVLKKTEKAFNQKQIAPPSPKHPPPSPSEQDKSPFTSETRATEFEFGETTPSRRNSLPQRPREPPPLPPPSSDQQPSYNEPTGSSVMNEGPDTSFLHEGEPPPVPPPRNKHRSFHRHSIDLAQHSSINISPDQVTVSDSFENIYNRNLPVPQSDPPDVIYRRELPVPPSDVQENPSVRTLPRTPSPRPENHYEKHLPGNQEDAPGLNDSHYDLQIPENIYSGAENIYSHHLPRRSSAKPDVGGDDEATYAGVYRRDLPNHDSPPPPPPPRPPGTHIASNDGRYEEPKALAVEKQATPLPPVPQPPSSSSSSSSASLPPPAPPPPPPLLLTHPDDKHPPLQPLAAIMLAKRTKLKKVVLKPGQKHSNKPSRPPNPVGPKVSKKIDHLRRILENSGVMAPYINHMMSQQSAAAATEGAPSFQEEGEEDKLTALARQNRARSSSRSLSPGSRNMSPANPRETNQRFSYLPEAALARIRSPDRRASESSDQNSDKASSPRPSRASRRQPTRSRLASMGSEHHDDKSYASTIQEADEVDSYGPEPDYDDGDVERLESTLRRRLEKPQHLPTINPRTQHQYDRVPDPPSELHLFFKKRQEQMRQGTAGDAVDRADGQTSALTQITDQVEQEMTSW